jgi:hypothetical protein
MAASLSSARLGKILSASFYFAAFLLLSNQLFRFMALGGVFMTNQTLRRSRRMQDMDPPFAAVNCRYPLSVNINGDINPHS